MSLFFVFCHTNGVQALRKACKLLGLRSEPSWTPTHGNQAIQRCRYPRRGSCLLGQSYFPLLAWSVLLPSDCTLLCSAIWSVIECPPVHGARERLIFFPQHLLKIQHTSWKPAAGPGTVPLTGTYIVYQVSCVSMRNLRFRGAYEFPGTHSQKAANSNRDPSTTYQL